MTGIRPHRPALSLLAALLLMLILSPAASADTTSTILADCGKEQVPKGFAQQDYSKALKKMSPFLAEYTDCEELIHRAQLAAVGAGRRGSGGGGGLGAAGANRTGAPTGAVAPPTPVEQRALEHAHRAGSAPVRVGDRVINPGVIHADVASAVSSLPTPLLVILSFLLACAFAVLGGTIWNRVRSGRAG